MEGLFGGVPFAPPSVDAPQPSYGHYTRNHRFINNDVRKLDRREARFRSIVASTYYHRDMLHDYATGQSFRSVIVQPRRNGMVERPWTTHGYLALTMHSSRGGRWQPSLARSGGAEIRETSRFRGLWLTERFLPDPSTHRVKRVCPLQLQQDYFPRLRSRRLSRSRPSLSSFV